MTGLALLPLDTRTLPGWPAAENPSGMTLLFVLVGIPAAITLVIVIWQTVGALAARNRATSTGVIAETATDAPQVRGGEGARAVTTGPRGDSTAAETVFGEHEDHIV